MPPRAIQTNLPTAQPAVTLWPSTTAASTTAKITAATPSLNRLSASTSVVSRSEMPRRWNMAVTLTGSVAAISAPNSSASDQVRPPT